MAFKKFSATSKAIKIVYQRGCKLVTPSFIFFYLDSDIEQQFFVASKKVGNAVKRNRCKRRLRELFRLHLKPNLNKSCAVILLARKATHQVPFKQLIADGHNILNKLGQ